MVAGEHDAIINEQKFFLLNLINPILNEKLLKSKLVELAIEAISIESKSNL